MVRYRIDFIFAKIGFTRLQQLFHARKAWTALKSYEEKRPRPFRIRVNDVKLFVRSPDAAEEESVEHILPDPISKKVGLGCAALFCYSLLYDTAALCCYHPVLVYTHVANRLLWCLMELSHVLLHS